MDRGGGPAAPYGIKNASKAVPTEAPPDEFFKQIRAESFQHQIPKYLFLGPQFADCFAYNANKNDVLRALRSTVQIDTIHCLLRGKYFLPEGQSVLLQKNVIERCAKSTRMYPTDFNFPKFQGKYETTFKVVDGDCLELALWAKHQYKCNPVCLVMASSSNPGGGYKTGSGAQEENLHRRTSLLHCLDDPYLLNPGKKWTYPLAEFGGFYVGEAVVFREGEQNGYAYMKEPQLMSFVGVSSYSNPPLETTSDGENIIASNLAKRVLRKLKAILDIAASNNHDVVILSAFGCGAYGNPPKHMARLFKETISGHFKGVFKEIIFAIFDDHNAYKLDPDGNLTSFAKVFKTEVLTWRGGKFQED